MSSQLETKALDQRSEITIAVEKLVIAHQAESSDNEIDGIANGDAVGAQGAVKTRCFEGDVLPHHRHDGEATENALQSLRMMIVARAPEDLQQDKVADQDLVCS